MTCTFGSAASAHAAAGPGRSSPRPSQRPRRPADWRIHREEHELATSDVDGPRVYLRREGVTKDGATGRMFDAERDDTDLRAFAARCESDRHHFRFIVSPDDATELSDLKPFTRELMAQAQRDLGTRLDWVAVDHWNTEHPHVHVIILGRADDGHDLVISRDYIREGMRARAEGLVTRELGPRSEQEIRRTLEERS